MSLIYFIVNKSFAIDSFNIYLIITIMKKSFFLVISFVLASFLLSSYNEGDSRSAIVENIEALAAPTNPVGQLCYAGCHGIEEYSICVLCRECKIFLWKYQGIGSTGQCPEEE
jgi:hypothetical protein